MRVEAADLAERMFDEQQAGGHFEAQPVAGIGPRSRARNTIEFAQQFCQRRRVQAGAGFAQSQHFIFESGGHARIAACNAVPQGLGLRQPGTGGGERHRVDLAIPLAFEIGRHLAIEPIGVTDLP